MNQVDALFGKPGPANRNQVQFRSDATQGAGDSGCVKVS